MSYGYEHRKEAIATRLARAEGQVRGVARMVEDDEYCIDILTQIAAIKGALDQVALELLHDHTTHCLASNRPEKADELVKSVGRLLGR